MRKNPPRLIIISLTVIVSFLIISAGVSAASKPVLKYGMSGSAVKTLQTDLKKLGFFSSTPTGYFGQITLTSVKNFQKKYNLPVTGVVASLTHQKIDQLLKSSQKKKESKPEGLKKGDTGDDVRKLQEDLAALGYMKVAATGNFASITEAALKQFQKNYGIEPHGVADKQTLTMIGRLLEQQKSASRGDSGRERILPREIVPLYDVTRQWISGLPKEPYLKGVGKYEGVVIHYTDNPGDNAVLEANYVKNNWQNAFVHEFIDADRIIQVADPDYKAWGAGKYANDKYIHLELCHENTQEDFELSYKKLVRRAAEYLYRLDLGVTPAKADGSGTLWGHIHVTRYLGGTDHVDPIAYMAKWNITWDDLVKAVAEEYNAIARENIITAENSTAAGKEAIAENTDNEEKNSTAEDAAATDNIQDEMPENNDQP